MRFISGAITAVVFLMLAAVGFTVLNPIGDGAQTASAAQPSGPEADTVTRTNASLLSATDPTALSDHIPVALPEPQTDGTVSAQATAQTTPKADDGPIQIVAPAAPLALDPTPVSTLFPDASTGRPDIRPVAWLPPVQDYSPMPPVADTTAAPKADLVFVSGNRVNMRTGPGSNYSWVATLTRGTGLILLEKGNRWYKVQTKVDGAVVTGWMASAFLSSAPVDVQAAAIGG